MARKPHPSAVLKHLPDDDQAALYDFLKGGKTLAEGVAWVFSNNGVRTSDSSLSEWRGWYELGQNIRAWNDDAEGVKAALMESGEVDPDLAAKVAEGVFMIRAAKEGDVKAFVQVASIVQRHEELRAKKKEHTDKMTLAGKKLELSKADLARKNRELEARLADMERKQREAEALLTKGSKDGGITEETVQAIRDLLGFSLPAAPTQAE